MAIRGGSRVTHLAATLDKNVKTSCCGYNALLVHHVMSGDGASGYVSLKMSDAESGSYIAHHGDGTNIKAENATDSYISIFKGIMDWITVELHVSVGTHTVTVQPINI